MTCAKQIVIATIENNGSVWVGRNNCKNPQEKCPREGMRTGEGYYLCKEVCQQENHAEVDACMQAGVEARGGIMTIEGHTYACENCMNMIIAHGIKVIIFKL